MNFYGGSDGGYYPCKGDSPNVGYTDGVSFNRETADSILKEINKRLEVQNEKIDNILNLLKKEEDNNGNSYS